MKKEELRIGNLVDWNGEIAIVSQLLELEMFFKCGETDLYENTKPIPLTEEWLLKFGIAKWILGGRFEVRTNEAYSVSVYAWSNGTCIFICHLNYVHELQNWYYLHSNKEELTFKTK